MADDPAFAELMARLRSGDAGAADAVFRRFAGRLAALARSHLDARVRQKVDAEDVLQSAFRTFFRRHAEGLLELESWDGLWGLLTVITLRKCGHKVEHFPAARRDVRREAAPPRGEDSSAPAWEAVAREPTPSEAAVLAETVEGLLRGLDGRDRRIVELGLQGEEVAAIAAEAGCSERTVERVLARLRQRLERMRDEPEGV